MTVTEWKIRNEESMSGHKYIEFVVNQETKKTCKKVFDFTNTDWEALMQGANEWKPQENEELETKVERFSVFMEAQCKRIIKKRVLKQTYESNGWWNDRLRERRCNLRRTRRAWQQTRGGEQEQETRNSFLRVRKEFKNELREAKVAWIDLECARMNEQDPWHKLWRVIGGERGCKGIGTILKEDGSFTLNETESNRHLVSMYFPENEV